MSQSQSYPTVAESAVPSLGVDETEIDAHENATINDPQSKTLPTGNHDGRNGAVGEDDQVTPEQAEKEGLPEQKHAGAVGYGPNYANKNGITLVDKFVGIKEQLVGKVTNNPGLVQTGHKRKIGELKRIEQEDDANPFEN